jgi:outer membrane lipoprotein-sorting protein
VLGSEKVGSRDAWALRGTLDGDNPETLYFDAQTGLLLRKSIYNNTPLGKYTINTDYEDYRDVGGVKIPFLIRTLSVSPADTMVVHVEKVENNTAIDAAKLAKPAAR